MDPSRPFERDEGVARELSARACSGLEPEPGRFAELLRIGRQLGYPI